MKAKGDSMLEGDFLMNGLERIFEGEELSEDELRRMMECAAKPGVLDTRENPIENICCWPPSGRCSYLIGAYVFYAENREIENPSRYTYQQFLEQTSRLGSGQEEWGRTLAELRNQGAALECL